VAETNAAAEPTNAAAEPFAAAGAGQGRGEGGCQRRKQGGRGGIRLFAALLFQPCDAHAFARDQQVCFMSIQSNTFRPSPLPTSRRTRGRKGPTGVCVYLLLISYVRPSPPPTSRRERKSPACVYVCGFVYATDNAWRRPVMYVCGFVYATDNARLHPVCLFPGVFMLVLACVSRTCSRKNTHTRTHTHTHFQTRTHTTQHKQHKRAHAVLQSGRGKRLRAEARERALREQRADMLAAGAFCLCRFAFVCLRKVGGPRRGRAHCALRGRTCLLRVRFCVFGQTAAGGGEGKSIARAAGENACSVAF
jgi:hypothetical protein